MTYMDQYVLEISWSTRATDALVQEAIQDDIPVSMEMPIRTAVVELNDGDVPDADIYIKFISLILMNKMGKPIQAIATQIGLLAGQEDTELAFEWGLQLVKRCAGTRLYNLVFKDEEWYVIPNFVLDKKTRQKIENLQYLPPMQITPKAWTNNRNGGWLWEKKHLVLGSKFTKHEEPLAYDTVNKLQQIAWEIDADTYVHESNTNRNFNKKKFLRVISEYLGKPFYFVWRYDSRGRSYTSGYDLNLQSNEYGKALLSLHHKEHIERLDNLYVAIANHAGNDKLTWQERIEWTEQADLSPEAVDKWDQPILGRKALRALDDAIEGRKSGYVMSLDATSSGIQVMAALSGCEETARLVNMVDPNIRYDLYTVIADEMSAMLNRPISRKLTKQAGMTHYYNSKATPAALFNDEEIEAFYEVLNGKLPGAEDVMETINECWQLDKDHHSWVMPDGHTVYVPIVEGTNITFKDEQLGDIPLRFYSQKPSENFRSLCPNICHSVDGYVAREMVRRCDFQLAHIHDCFLFSPDHLQEVADTYRAIMAEIADSDLLQDILRQVTGSNTLIITKYGNSLSELILESEYMLS